MELEVDHLVDYSADGGRLTVSLSGAAEHAGRTFAVGVFVPFDPNDGPGDAVRRDSALIETDGTAELLFGETDVERWFTGGEEYSIIMVIFLEGTVDSGPTTGDLVYTVVPETYTPVPWYVAGDRHMWPAYSGFVEFVEPDNEG